MKTTLPLLLLLLLLTGCSTHEGEDSFVKEVFQTSGASSLRGYLYDLDGLLEQYRQKLNKRNPRAYSKAHEASLRDEIKEQTDKIRLPLVAAAAPQYKQYLKIAFSPKPLENRNDYLVLAVHKLIYYAYGRERFHALSAMQYDIEKLQEAHHALQAIQWKIKHARDERGKYLFLTWQQNWQVELQKRLEGGDKLSDGLILDLQPIKSGEESLLDPSNMSFENITGNMLYIVAETISILGGEPSSLGAQSLKSFFFFL